MWDTSSSGARSEKPMSDERTTRSSCHTRDFFLFPISCLRRVFWVYDVRECLAIRALLSVSWHCRVATSRHCVWTRDTRFGSVLVWCDEVVSEEKHSRVWFRTKSFVHPFGTKGEGGGGSRVAQKGNGIVLFLHVPSAKQRKPTEEEEEAEILSIYKKRKKAIPHPARRLSICWLLIRKKFYDST